MARLLILTLSSGEAALPILRRQLAAQSFRGFEHQIIEGLPNQAAHNRLYRTIAERASSFDLFLKLDADMTLRRPAALEEVVRAAGRHPDVQHFTFPIWDGFTELETLGVHLFRSGVSWGDITDDLFVDPDPPNVTRMMWDGPPAPFANHGEIVSDFECFAFGVHKFLKVAQRNRTEGERSRKAHKFVRHMSNCARIRDLYRATGASRHQLALAGVIWAMDHEWMSSMLSKAELQDVFEREILSTDARWARRVDRLARNIVVWRFSLMRSLGPRRALA
ncbi:MAG TPA: hypothetical protein VGD94_20520 [Vicinamibacterales bacterium]